jgi:hypothetical protein
MTVVEIRLTCEPDGAPVRSLPFMVIADDADRCGLYVDEPDVIAQLAPDENRGRFEATWDGEWKFGRRIQDA